MSCQKNYNNLLQQNKKLSTQIQQIKQFSDENNNMDLGSNRMNLIESTYENNFIV
jgi:hypothetical protein